MVVTGAGLWVVPFWTLPSVTIPRTVLARPKTKMATIATFNAKRDRSSDMQILPVTGAFRRDHR
jgi:hypothetical protein